MAPDLPASIAAQALIQTAITLRAAIYLAVISLCLLVYDCAITIDQEVKFVWGQRWSFGKFVYIFIRYATILMMAGHVASMLLFRPSSSLCHTAETIFVWSEVAIIIAGSSILIVRTWLLWGGARWVLVCLIGGLLVASVLSIYYVYIDTENSGIILNVAPKLLPGCLVNIPPTTWRPFVFPLFYETFIIVLTVIKVSSMSSRAPLVMRLFLDGTLYYIVVVAVLLLTTIGAAHAPTRPLVIGSGFHTACISIGCSRLVLSLHSWAFKNKHSSTARPSQNVTNGRGSHSSTPSRSFSKGSVLAQSEYELAPLSNSVPCQIKINIAVDSITSTSALPPPQAAAPYERSMLPDIERPSLPERIWPKNPSIYTQQHQRQHRPPRSSSLYPAGPVFRRE